MPQTPPSNGPIRQWGKPAALLVQPNLFYASSLMTKWSHQICCARVVAASASKRKEGRLHVARNHGIKVVSFRLGLLRFLYRPQKFFAEVFPFPREEVPGVNVINLEHEPGR